MRQRRYFSFSIWAPNLSFAVIATVVAIGALDESRQTVPPGRSTDAFDFLADSCAAIGIAATAPLLVRRKPQHR